MNTYCNDISPDVNGNICEMIYDDFTGEQIGCSEGCLYYNVGWGTNDGLDCFYKEDINTLIDLRDPLDPDGTYANSHIIDYTGNFTTFSQGRVVEMNMYDALYIPLSIGNLSALTHLNIAYLDSSASLPDIFGDLSSLQYLYLSNNDLTSLPESFGDLSSLYNLDLSNNDLTSFPDIFGDLSSLQSLSLSNNDLTSLPDIFGDLSSLQYLYLSNNDLTSLPESFGNLPSLYSLDLSSNALTSLPESFGNLPSLYSLDLSSNALTSLPESFGNLPSLYSLDLSSNALTSLPESFGNLPSLYSLDLSSNALTSLPESICNINIYSDQGMNLSYNNLCEEYLFLDVPLTGSTCIDQLYWGTQDESNCDDCGITLTDDHVANSNDLGCGCFVELDEFGNCPSCENIEPIEDLVYSGSGNTTYHSINYSAFEHCESLNINIEVFGDYGSSSEYAEIYIEGAYYGVLGYYSYSYDCAYPISENIVIPTSNIQGSYLDVEIYNTSSVNFDCYGYYYDSSSYHKVTLSASNDFQDDSQHDSTGESCTFWWYGASYSGVVDCSGVCQYYNWPNDSSNDGYCDDGSNINYNYSDFDCSYFNYDGGDCSVLSTGSDLGKKIKVAKMDDLNPSSHTLYLDLKSDK